MQNRHGQVISGFRGVVGGRSPPGATCNGTLFQEDCAKPPSLARAKEAAMLVNLHLWEAPVRNLDWVTSAFGYR